MSYDALVWLLVGLGVGVAGSLLLLMAYAGLERGRLGRRLRRARAQQVEAADAKPAPVVRPPGSRLDMPRAVAAKPVPEAVAVEPVDPAVAAPEPEAPPVPEVMPQEAEVKPPVVAAPVPRPVAPAEPRLVQSVEAMFAEAFANDKLPASGPDEKTS